jgi:ribosome maturation factor RimP
LQIVYYFCILSVSSPASIAGLFFEFNTMPSNLVENLKEIATPIVEQHGAFIVELQLRGERTSKVVELFVDTDTGITLEACSLISREFSAALDTADSIPGRYRLDVSSPGTEKPLKLKRQYNRNIGHKAKVVTEINGEKISTEGTLEEVKENSIILSAGSKHTEILFDDIVQTIIIPTIKKI